MSYQEQQRLAAHMQSLYDISRAFGGVVDEAGMMAVAARLARTHLGAESVYLLELRDAEGTPVRPSANQEVSQIMARWGWHADGSFQPWTAENPDPDNIWHAMTHANHTMAFADLPTLAHPNVRALVTANGWRSGLFIPLWAGGESLGALGLGYHSGYHTFSRDDVELADTLGAETARALAGLQIQRAQRQLRRQNAALQMSNWVLARHSRDLAVLNEFARNLTALLDVETLCGRVVELLATTFGYTQVSVALVENGVLRFRAWTGYQQIPNEADWPLSDGVSGRVVRTAQSALVPDVTVDPDYVPLGGDIRSEICVPLIGRDGVLGVINVESSAPDPLDEADLQLLTTLAPQVAIALDNAHLYAAARRQAYRRPRHPNPRSRTRHSRRPKLPRRSAIARGPGA
jgi:GAF domain-containing protein